MSWGPWVDTDEAVPAPGSYVRAEMCCRCCDRVSLVAEGIFAGPEGERFNWVGEPRIVDGDVYATVLRSVTVGVYAARWRPWRGPEGVAERNRTKERENEDA